MRKTHVLSEERPWKRSIPRRTPSQVSCTTSSASAAVGTYIRATASRAALCSSTSSVNACSSPRRSAASRSWPGSAVTVGTLVDSIDADQLDSERTQPLEHAVELRLVGELAGQGGGAGSRLPRNPVDRRGEALAQATLHDDLIAGGLHDSSMD